MDTTKKILIIVENLPVPHDRRVWQESLCLKENGYEVSVICPKGKEYIKNYECINGIHIYRHPLPIEARRSIEYLIEYSIALFWESILTLRVFLKHGFDVIQACNPPDTIVFIALFYKILFKKKFVFDQHDGNPEIWLAKGKKKNFIYKILLFLEQATFHAASISFAVNKPYKDIAIRRGKMKKKDVFIVRNSPNLKDYHINSITKSRDSKIIVGYLGVMGKQDSIDGLLKSIEYIVHIKKRNNIFLQLMGNGPEFNYLKNMCSDLYIKNHVQFTGWISGKNYINYMSNCDICVNADIVNEYNKYCSPNKVYEYMLFSKPIVQFEMPENQYIAGNSSLYAAENNYIDMAEKILILADDPVKREQMGKIGRIRFEKTFTWEKSSKTLISAYKYLFEEKNKIRQ